MPLITGTIDEQGAAACVLVGVSENRRKRLLGVGHPLPEEIPLRLQIDTGSFATGFPVRYFHALGISPFRSIRVRSSSTRPGEPHLAEQFDISLTLISGTTRVTIPSVHAIACEDFDADIQGLLGRDVLDHCIFSYYGPNSQFSLAF